LISAAVIFMSGALMMGYCVAAMFFMRFWRLTHDRLFVCFAAAFTLLAVQRLVLIVWSESDLIYLVRLCAFVIILAAIVDKNRAR